MKPGSSVLCTCVCLLCATVLGAQTWITAGDMNVARAAHALIRLDSGQVLAVGELNTGAPVTNRTELYDPASRTWSYTGSTNLTHTDTTAVLLSDGRVLVAGGRFGSTSLQTAEVYNPTSGQWTVTGNMNIKRVLHTLTLLKNGKVLACGGYDGGTFQASAELYDPTTGAWQTTGTMILGRWQHAAVLLNDGRVLVAGGENYNAGSSLNSAEIYDPTTGVWSATPPMNAKRANGQIGILGDGRAIVTGGYHDSTISERTAELFDPSTGRWTLTGSMATPRSNHVLVKLSNGNFLAAGGSVGGFVGFGNYTNTAEIYDYLTGVWSTVGSMATNRYNFAGVLLNDGSVLVAGGGNATFNGPLKSAEVLLGLPIGSCPVPQITGVWPNHGGNTGQVTVQVYGCGFKVGALPKLSGNGPDIRGSLVNLLNAYSLKVTFDLSGAAAGNRALVVNNPDATSASLVNGFTVDKGGAPDIAVSLIGRNVMRATQTQIYLVSLVNQGSVDAGPQRVWLAFPSYVQWSAPETAPSSAGQLNGTAFIAFDSKGIAAGSSLQIPILLTAPDNPIYAHQKFQVQVWEEAK